MRIYLDVSCLNRPFDDASQERVRLEAEAVRLIIARIDSGDWQQVSSEMAEIEVAAIREVELRRSVRRLLPGEDVTIRLNEAVFKKADDLVRRGLKTADALHVAAADERHADVLLTCDDRLLKWSVRHRSLIRIKLFNPVDWLTNHADA